MQFHNKLLCLFGWSLAISKQCCVHLISLDLQVRKVLQVSKESLEKKVSREIREIQESKVLQVSKK